MKCLILGGTGQLGRALIAAAPAGMDITAPPRAICDIAESVSVQRTLNQIRPALVINAAGYTDVNGAESHAREARAVNAQGPAALAAFCREQGAKLFQLSTDFVFDGAAHAPYAEDAPTYPLNEYGRGKEEGEKQVRREHAGAVIIRTAWLYAGEGRNFVNTMLGQMQARDEVRVVADQIGTPTYARNLARALWRLAAKDTSGIYHITDEGEASWHDFALAIRDEALGLGLLIRRPEIIAISAADFPSPARRPAYSVLGKSRLHAELGLGQDWHAALKDMLIAKKREL